MDRYFDKVLVERERVGWRGPRANISGKDKRMMQRDPETALSFESTSRSRGGTKRLGEHLGPLRRFLRGAVGRPWQKVLSEIKQALPGTDPVRRHIWSHIEGYVATEVVWIGKKLVYLRPYGREVIWQSFYVCPRTGLLRATPRKHRKTPAVRVNRGARYCYLRNDRDWFEVTLERCPIGRDAWFHDRFLQLTFTLTAEVAARLEQTYGRSNCYALSKRALNVNEVRDLRLPTWD